MYRIAIIAILSVASILLFGSEPTQQSSDIKQRVLREGVNFIALKGAILNGDYGRFRKEFDKIPDNMKAPLINENRLLRDAAGAENKNERIFKDLLSVEGVEVNIRGLWGTPLHEAARHGKTEIVKMLLREDNIQVNIKYFHSKISPLETAIVSGHADVVNLLIQDPRVIITDGAINLARERKDQSMYFMLTLHRLAETLMVLHNALPAAMS